MRGLALRRRNQILVTIFLLFGSVVAPFAARAADDATVKLYETKCVACHAADGGGNTTVGKTLKIKDLRDPEIGKETDSALMEIVAKGKDKMPAYEKTLKPDQIKGLVAYIRTLAEKK